MNNLKFIIVIALALFYNSYELNAQTNDSLIMEFYFADGFQNDTVDFQINGVIVFEDVLMKSNPYYSLTEYDLKILKNDEDYFAVSLHNDLLKKITDFNSGNIEIKMNVGETELLKTFDQNNGRYVTIFYSVHNKKWQLSQTPIQPGFE